MLRSADIFGPDEQHANRVQIALETERAKRDARRILDAEQRGPVVVPAVETLRERLERPRQQLTYRIDSLQPAGTRAMLVAQFKAGKTSLRDNLIRCLVDGDDFLDRYPVRAVTGTVVVIDTEMSEAQLDLWMGAQRIRHDDRVVVISLRGRAAAFNILDAETRAGWVRRFQPWQPEYFILDNLRPMFDALGLDEHRDAGQYLVALDAFLQEACIPEALIVHHMGHTGERSRGDSRLRDWPDVEIRLMRQDENPSSPRFLTAYGRDVDVPESRLDYDPATRRLTIVGGSRRDQKTEAALNAVAEALTASEQPMSGRAIKEALADAEHARDTIDKALKHGTETGRLTVKDGPRKAKLYGVSVRVSGSVRTVSDGHVSECPAAYIEADTHGHTEDVSVSGPSEAFEFDHDPFGS